MSLPGHILVHSGVVVTYEEPQSSPAEWIEGEPGPQGGGQATDSAPFRCVLFLPSPGGEQENAYRPRVVTEPTLLYNATRPDQSAVILNDEDEVLVTAPELAAWTGAATALWQCVGDAQPFGPPGKVIGVQSTLRMIHD